VLRGFTAFSVDEAALHLFRIMAARLVLDDDETAAETLSDLDAILDKIGAMIDVVRSDPANLDDVINPKPGVAKTETEAEQAGDAVA